jgi:hypothetical protein
LLLFLKKALARVFDEINKYVSFKLFFESYGVQSKVLSAFKKSADNAYLNTDAFTDVGI